MKPILIFFVVCAVSCLIAWVGGYDFNYRSSGVAVWTMLTLMFAGIAALAQRDFGHA